MIATDGIDTFEAATKVPSIVNVGRSRRFAIGISKSLIEGGTRFGIPGSIEYVIEFLNSTYEGVTERAKRLLEK